MFTDYYKNNKPDENDYRTHYAHMRDVASCNRKKYFLPFNQYKKDKFVYKIEYHSYVKKYIRIKEIYKEIVDIFTNGFNKNK